MEHRENSFLEKEPVGKLMMKYAVPCINTDYMSTDDAAALIARAAIGRCFEASPVLTSQFSNNRDVVIGYYLTEVWAEFASFSDELPNKNWKLPNKYDKVE